MKKRSVLFRKIIVCAFSITTMLLGQAEGETTMKAIRTSSPPTIDGKLTDSCWQRAIPITNFKINNTNNPAKYQSIGYILYDDNNVYVGMKCLDPNINNIRTSLKEHDESVFGDDCIEIMLDTKLDMTDYYHFAVNASGSKFDRSCAQGGWLGDSSWNGTWKAKSHIGKDYWSCEVAIPFYTLGITSKVSSTWGINLCREKKNPFENSSIAEDGAFNIAGRFLKLEGLDADFKKYCYEVGNITISTEIKDKNLHAAVKAPVKNLTGKKQEVKIEGWLIGPDKKPHIKSDIWELESEEEKDNKIGPFILKTQGEYDCYFTISDPKTQKTLYLSKTKLNVSYVPMAINVIEPFYRDTIFETQNLEKVILEVKVNLPEKDLKDKKLFVGIKEENKSELVVEKIIELPSKINKVEFSCSKLPYGKLLITANLKEKNDTSIAVIENNLQKLPYKKGEVWLGKDLNWYVDGKLFFFNGAWLRNGIIGNNRYLNAVFAWDMTKERKLQGQKVVIHCFTITRAARDEKKIAELQVELRERIQKFRDEPDLFGYHLDDEPSIAVKNMRALYEVVREEDPYHPVIITHYTSEGGQNYVEGADYHSFHRYPPYMKNKKINDMSSIMGFADHFQKIGKESRKFIGYLVQGFNFGDYLKINERIRSYYEARGATFMTMIGGAKGFIQYNRQTDHYPEVKIGGPYQVQELAYLGKAITAPNSKLEVKASSEKIRTHLKDVDGQLYLFAVNVDMEPSQARITIHGIGKYSNLLNVISEDRKIKIKEDSFSDKFDAFEVHIYTTSQKKTGLTTVKEICRMIDEANQARRKPGNLAFQMHEGDTVIISASSNKGARPEREDLGLWHLADGVIDTKFDGYWKAMWCDKTPSELPDWVEIKLPRKHNVGRVVVYPFERSLKDYEIQAFVAGRWKIMDKVSGKNEEVIAHRFKQVNTDRIRVWITGTNGPNSKITEIEIYEK
ncbi:MAG: carbohydrate binding family 9 domain-containing protein [bacterium]|nr:carbohydrate binding family 9 domain-containing protein [bacterium]